MAALLLLMLAVGGWHLRLLVRGSAWVKNPYIKKCFLEPTAPKATRGDVQASLVVALDRAGKHCWHSHCWLRTGVVRTFVFRTLVVQVSRQQCERQKCERHQCEARSANANSAKRQQCDWDKCAKVKCAKVRSANATLVRSDKTPNWFKSREAAAAFALRMEFFFSLFLSQSVSLSLSGYTLGLG